MPLLQGQFFKLVNDPCLIDHNGPVFIIEHTGEKFINESDYKDRIALYSQSIWTCQVSGRSNMNHKEAWLNEVKLRSMVEASVGDTFKPPILALVHHSTAPLEHLVESASAMFYSQFYVGEELEYSTPGIDRIQTVKVLSSRLINPPTPHDCNSFDNLSNGDHSTLNGASANGTDASKLSPTKQKIASKLRRDKVYEIKMLEDGRVIAGVPVTFLQRKHKPPSKDNIRLFIRANALRSKSPQSPCPWIVTEEAMSRYKVSRVNVSPVNNVLPAVSNHVVPQSNVTLAKRKLEDCFGVGEASHPAKMARVEYSNGQNAAAIVESSNVQHLSQTNSSNVQHMTQTHISNVHHSTSSNVQHMSQSNSSNVQHSSQTNVQHMSQTNSSDVQHSSQTNGTAEPSNEMESSDDDGIQFIGNGTSQAPSAAVHPSLVSIPMNPTILQVPQSNFALFHNNTLSTIAQILKTPQLQQSFINASTLNANPPSFMTPNMQRAPTPLNAPVFSPQSNLLNSSQSSVGTPDSRYSLVPGKNITFGPDGQLIKRRGRPAMTPEEKARKKELQRQMSGVFLSMGIKEDEAEGSSNANMEQFSSPTKSVTSSPSKSPTKKLHTSETVMRMPMIRRLLFEQKNKKTNRGYARKLIYSLDHAVTRLSLQQIHLVTDDSLKEALIQRHERMIEKRMINNMDVEEREAYLREKAKEDATRRRQERQELNRKLEDQKLMNLAPLPAPSPVRTGNSISDKHFSDIAMLTEFMECYQEVFGHTKCEFTTTKLLKAVNLGKNGYQFISGLLCTMLPVVLYDSNLTHYKELGIPLREIPVSFQTAPELARLCLKHQKLVQEEVQESLEDDEDLIIGEEEDELSEDLLEKLTMVELWELTPEELVAFLIALTHRCMAADLLAVHVEKMEEKATKIYKERASLKKEKVKEDTEIKQKKKEERNARKMNKRKPGRPKGFSPKLGVTIADFYQRENLRKDLIAGRQKRKTGTEKLEEEKKDVEEKEMMTTKELREQRFRECELILEERKRSLRISPLGTDRNHCRYWLFHNTTPGLYVEKGWLHEHADYSVDIPGIEKCDGAGLANENESPLPTPTKGKGRPKALSFLDDDAANQTLPPNVQNEWYVYKTEEEVNALIDALSDKGVREHYLKQNIISKKEKIFENLSYFPKEKKEVKEEEEEEEDPLKISLTEEEIKEELSADVKEEGDEYEFEEMEDFIGQVLITLKEDICQIEKEVIEGNLGAVENYDDWQARVMENDDVHILAEQLVEAQKGLSLKNLKGFMAPSKKAVYTTLGEGAEAGEEAGGDEADQQMTLVVTEYVVVESAATVTWREAVLACKTLARLHVMVGMFDSCIKWDRSLALKKCSVCSKKDKNNDTLLLCEKCDKCLHWLCQRPKPKDKVAPLIWHCPICSKKVEQQEAESERRKSRLLEVANTPIASCKQCGGRSGLITCCGCNASYHSECHVPPPTSRARKNWKCAECDKIPPVVEKKIPSTPVSSRRESTEVSEARKIADTERRRKLAANKPRTSKGQFLSKAALAAIAAKKKKGSTVTRNNSSGGASSGGRSEEYDSGAADSEGEEVNGSENEPMSADREEHDGGDREEHDEDSEEEAEDSEEEEEQ